MPPPPRLKVLGPEPPSLCRQGPCSHYHELRVRLDAASPMDGSDDIMHTQLERSCYPTSGIEIDLSDSPVFECSRWAPDVQRQYQLDALRRDYNLSNAGVKYYRELAEWKAEQKRIAAEVTTYAEAEYSPKTVLEQLAEQMDAGDTLQIRHRGLGTVADSVFVSFLRTDDAAFDDGRLEHIKSEVLLTSKSYQLRVVGPDGETIKATSRYDHESTPAPKETV